MFESDSYRAHALGIAVGETSPEITHFRGTPKISLNSELEQQYEINDRLRGYLFFACLFGVGSFIAAVGEAVSFRVIPHG